VLTGLGFVPIIPGVEKWEEGKEDINKYKAEVSRGHFNHVVDKNTYAVLVINENKNGIVNYIGANTFAEIAFAFYFGKKIFILNGVYAPYGDELSAWGACFLNGKMCEIK
jgi:hypothetical protein